LHPRYFQPDSKIYDILNIRRHERFVIVRFVAWEAIHDRGEQGFLLNQKNKMIIELSKYVKVFITSEGELPDDLKQFQIKIQPEKMHDVLAYTELYIGEGATMASECACIGTPAIYISSLPLMGYLKEEQERGLLYHFNSSEGVFEKALELLNDPDSKHIHEHRCQKMLKDKIDVTAFMVWFVENYPESIKIMRDNPDFQYKFR
jgi:predicted glycosyltransferase